MAYSTRLLLCVYYYTSMYETKGYIIYCERLFNLIVFEYFGGLQREKFHKNGISVIFGILGILERSKENPMNVI